MLDQPMADGITEAEILDFLRRVESGEVLLTPVEAPQEVYAGNVDYIASNGWSLTIFNDCNEWDYIDRVQSSDGRACDFDDMWNMMPQASEYHPSEEVAWTRYGIPGYLKFRCSRCGRPLKNEEFGTGLLVCTGCISSAN